MSMSGSVVSAAWKPTSESDARFISEGLHSNCVAALIVNLRDHSTDDEQLLRHPFGGYERSICEP
jgi:hypothetical protein